MATENTEESAPKQTHHWRALFQFLRFVWVENAASVRIRILLAVGLVGGTAALQTLAPLIFASAVDAFLQDQSLAVVAPTVLLLGYALVFSLARGFRELNYVVVIPLMNRVQVELRLKNVPSP